MRNILFITLLVYGCTFQFPASKTLYTLDTQDEFLISNIYANSFRLKRIEKKLELSYDIVLKNLKDSERSLNLGASQINYRSQSLPLSCYRYDSRQKDFKIKPQEQFRILCSGVLHQDFITSGDAKILITVPLENKSVSFQYIVREEDFK